MAAAGLAVVGVTLLAAGCSGSSTAAGASSSASAPASSSAAKGKGKDKHAGQGITGQITAINGQSWTVQDKKGHTYTVTINDKTQFGTKAQPASQQQFAVGGTVRVAGQVSGDTVTATRIATPQPKASSSAMPAPTTT